MNAFILFTYMIFGLITFFIIYLLRAKFKINRLYNTVFSILIYLVIASCFNYLKIDYLNNNIFMIFVFMFIWDFIYSTYILEEDFFNKKDNNIGYYIILILIGLFLNNNYISKVDIVFLSGEDIRLIVWSLLFLFIYNFIKEEKLFDKGFHTDKLIDEDNVLIMFTKLRKRYLNDINLSSRELELVIYSIMIFNNIKRSAVLRYFDNIIFKINSKKRKLGIMQVESNTFITDIESINIVIKDIKKIIGKKSSNGVYESAISKYMGDNNLEVLEIYNILKNFFKI